MLITPYKGRLVDLMVPPGDLPERFSDASRLPSVRLTARQMNDLELLATGASSPLNGFMAEKDYQRVLDDMRLADGTVFPIPVTLSVDDISHLTIGGDVALRDPGNELIAIMSLSEIYEWDPEHFAEAICGTSDPRHPLVSEISGWGRFNLSGQVSVLKLPAYSDFQELRLTPTETRHRLERLGRDNVVAFQTRNPMHRGHEEMTKRAIAMTGATLLLHPTVGMTMKGDIDPVTMIRTHQAASAYYPYGRVVLSLIPLAMRFAGPREAVWHAIIRRNYGANHFIVGRSHASPGSDSNGEPFYAPTAAQKLAERFASEIGVKILPFREFVYFPDQDRYDEKIDDGRPRRCWSLSGTRVREELLDEGKRIPEWLMRKEVSRILSESCPPRSAQGLCLWFTGLSGAGKSTTAAIVTALLLEEGRRVTLLDGDVVRTNLSKGLGFSKEDRDINIRRIGFVASEVVRHGGIAVCAAISPYCKSRKEVRQMFGNRQFIEIFVNTPLEVCEERDAKGLYALARSGEIQNFTGIDDIYEAPMAPEIVLDTIEHGAAHNARRIIELLRARGFLKGRNKRSGNGDQQRASAGSRSVLLESEVL